MSNVTIHFLTEDLVVAAPPGTPLADICDAAAADLTFACRSGSCGTCRVRVVRGLETCSPMGAEERDFLVGSEPNVRLACQVRVHGDVDVEYV